MKNSAPLKLFVILISSLLLFTGCAAFAGNQLTTVEAFPPLPDNSKKMVSSYSFSGGYDLFSEGEFQGNNLKHLEEEFVSVFQESGYFASIAPGNNGEMHIKIRILDKGNPAAVIPAFITGLSLYTIPSWGSDNYLVTANIKDTYGNMHEYNLEDSVTLVQWLPMIFVAPFKTIWGESLKVRQNIYRNLVLKMKEDGILSEVDSVDQSSVPAIMGGT